MSRPRIRWAHHAMSRISLTVHPNDNVTTLLDFKTEDWITQTGLALQETIAFGHKAALEPILQGQAIIKYGAAHRHCHPRHPKGSPCPYP